jgi:hypothetical protein
LHDVDNLHFLKHLNNITFKVLSVEDDTTNLSSEENCANITGPE